MLAVFSSSVVEHDFSDEPPAYGERLPTRLVPVLVNI